jgi:hypothetical protein
VWDGFATILDWRSSIQMGVDVPVPREVSRLQQRMIAPVELPTVYGVDRVAAGRDLVHDEWSRWLSGYFPDGSDSAYVTLTWSDEEAFKRYVFGAKRAIADASAFFTDLGIRQWFVCVEDHKWRDVPHIHGVVRLGDSMRRDYMWGLWRATRSSNARILPIQDGCFSYVTKYVFKDETATRLEWRL